MARLAALGMVACTGLATYAVKALSGHSLTHRQRSEWLQQCCRRLLDRINLQICVSGTVPPGGLIVSNHLSYVDILVLSAVCGCSFVSKIEVQKWPIFGTFARLTGTVFVRRESRNDAARAQSELQEVLGNGECVVLFPEGTTTDATRVLPFRSPMFQAAIEANTPITPCAISYALRDGDVGQELCYWGEMTLLPHLLNLFAKQRVWCSVSFGDAIRPTADRKALAEELHREVSILKTLNDERVQREMLASG